MPTPMASRRMTPAGHRWLMALLAVALFARALVPAGWMPATGGGLMLCDGMAPAVATAAGKHDHPGHEIPSPGDHPCAFAGPVAAVESPELATPLPPEVERTIERRRDFAIAIGQGLAAPPPPPTGPPSFA